jgi:hypothetical protein
MLVGCGGLELNTNAQGQDDDETSPTVCTQRTTPLDPSCPCSRRACSPPSMSCPRGTGKSATTRIGPDGGTASLSLPRSVPFQVEVFAGSLSSDVDLTLTELAESTPEGYEDWSPIFAIEPLAVDFLNGGALEIPWEVPHSGGGTVPRALTTFTAASLDGPWLPLADNYVNAGFCQATVLRGGYFFVGLAAADDACH